MQPSPECAVSAARSLAEITDRVALIERIHRLCKWVVTILLSTNCLLAPMVAVAQTARTTANQGLSAHYGWNDPSNNGGVNSLSLLATDDKTVAAGSRVYDKLGDPLVDYNLPAYDGNYTVTFQLYASTGVLGSGQNSTVTALLTTEYSTNSGASWTSVGGTSQLQVTRSFPGQTSNTQVFSPTLNFSGGSPVWIRLILRGTASGSAGGGLVKVQIYASSGWSSDPYAVTWSSTPPPAPTVSLPYSANLNGATDGVTYVHATPAVGSMGTAQSLALVYNSTAARPVVLVFLDATGPTSPAPSAFQLQVQLQSNGTNLTLLNGATSVYYTATPGIVDRLTAAIDARTNGLATGSYPVNLVLTSFYPTATQATVVATRILVNDQTASPSGAGVGLKGIAHLYTMTGSSGRLLVGGSGAMEYFDRTCSGCAFVSPAGESGTLVSYGDTLFRLTTLDGSFADFNTQGYLVRHNTLSSIQDLTFSWTNNLLTSVTDASGRGFTLTYSGGLLTQITDFAGRATSTTIAGGLLVKVADADGGVDSLTYNANNLLTQVNGRTGGVLNYGYNALQQGDTVRAPAANDYTGANVRPTSTVVTSAEVQWQPGSGGTSLGAPKGSIRPDTVYLSGTDPLGHVTKFQVDRFGLATTVVDAMGDVTTITRDTLGNATVLREPTGHVTTATYSGYFLMASYDSASRQSLKYTYGASTAGQGLSARYGWQNSSDGTNTLSLNAIDDQTVLPQNRLYNTLGDPSPGNNLPAVDSSYTVQYQLIATTPTVSAGNNSTITAQVKTEYSTNSGNSWLPVGDTSQVSATSTIGVVSNTQVSTHTLKFPGGSPVWIRLILRGIAAGNQGGGQVKVQVFQSAGWTVDPYPVTWFNYGADTRPRLLAIQGGPSRFDYLYHDGSQGPAGTLKEAYVGNTLAPGSVPQGGAVMGWHYPNANGQDTLVIDGAGDRSRWTFASAASGGNLIQSRDPLGHTTSFHYNSYGLVDTTTLANGVKQVSTSDAMNRDTAKTNGLGYITHYSYGPISLARVRDPKGQVYKFGLNAWGTRVAVYDLGDTTKVDSLKYDAGGEVRTQITRRGDTITVTYDQLGRLRTRSGPDFPAESLSYGLLPSGGSWRVASSSNGRDSLGYDKTDRLVYAAQYFPGDTTTYAMTYSYDSTGHVISRTAPTHGSSARWVYRSQLGVLDTMCAVGTCTALQRDSELKAISLVYNAGAASPWSQSLSYDSLHHVTGATWSGWTYDSLGRVSVQMGDPINTYPREVYTYDASGELVNACQMSLVSSPCVNEYNQNGTIAYAYDSAGNRADTTARAMISAGNRVTQFKGYAITYDANGDIVKEAGLGAVGVWTSTDTTTFQWNAVGQLTRVERWPAQGSHTVVTYRYDALGRRIGKSLNGVTTWFLYDRHLVEMDLDSATHAMKAEYGFTDDGGLYALRTPTDTAVAIVTPTIGTMLGLARARGAAVLKALPDRVGNSPLLPWGQEPADTGFIVRYRMGEQEYEQETGLYHMGARYYDPKLGRWLSEDPAGISGGMNLYSYVGNDPVNARDPSGLWQCEVYFGNNGYPSRFSCTVTSTECGGADKMDQCWLSIFVHLCGMYGGVVEGSACVFYPEISQRDQATLDQWLRDSEKESQRRFQLGLCPSCHYGQLPVPTRTTPEMDKCGRAWYAVGMDVNPAYKLLRIGKTARGAWRLVEHVGDVLIAIQQESVKGEVTVRGVLEDLGTGAIDDAAKDVFKGVPLVSLTIDLEEAREACRGIH
jgi:RHS repeat-associated protein